MVALTPVLSSLHELISSFIFHPAGSSQEGGLARLTGYSLIEKDLRFLVFVFFLVGNFVRLDYQLIFNI